MERQLFNQLLSEQAAIEERENALSRRAAEVLARTQRELHEVRNTTAELQDYTKRFD